MKHTLKLAVVALSMLAACNSNETKTEAGAQAQPATEVAAETADIKSIVGKTWMGMETKGEAIEALKAQIPADQQEKVMTEMAEMTKKSYIKINADNTFEMNNGVVTSNGKYELTDSGMKMTDSKGKEEVVTIKMVGADQMEVEAIDKDLGKMTTVYKAGS